MAIKKAGIKARLMTGIYVLQPNRAKLNKYSVNPTSRGPGALSAEVSSSDSDSGPIYQKI